MSRRIWAWAAGTLASLLLLLVAVAFWLLATTSGARWLLAEATPLLPTQLRIAELDGTLLKGVGFRGVSWTDDAVRFSVEQLQTRIELLPLLERQVRIRKLDVRDVDVVVGDRPQSDAVNEPFSLDLPITLRIETASISNIRIVTGDNELVIDRVGLSGQLSGSELQVGRLDIRSGLGDISLAGNANLAGAYPAAANAAWELRLQNQPPLSGILKLRGDISQYEIEHDLDAPYALSTRGTLAIVDGDLMVDLGNSWELLHFEAGDNRVVDIIDGRLRVAGVLDALTFEGDATIVSGDIPALAFAARGKRDADVVTFESVSISNDWGQLVANGETVIAPGLSWKFDVELSELDPAVADPRLSGNLQVTAKTAGRIVDEQPIIDVWVDNMGGNLNGYPVNGSGTLSFKNEHFQVSRSVVRVGDNRIDFDGSYGRQLQANAVVRFSDLSQFGIGAAGLLNGDVRITSDLKTFAATGKLNGESLAWNDYIVDTLATEFDLPATGSGTAMLRVVSAEYGSVVGRLRGRFAQERWSGEIQELTLASERLGQWALQDAADLSLSRSKITLGKTCLGTTSYAGIACSTLDYDFSGPMRFDASINKLPLSVFAANLPEGASVEGVIEAQASGQYRDQRLTANAGLTVLNLNLKAVFEGDDISASFDQAFAKASITDNRLVGDLEFRLVNQVDHIKSNIEIADIFDLNSALRGRGSLELSDLGVLSFFVPDLANPVGTIAGTVDVAGSLAAPEIIGEIGLSNGSFGVRRAGIAVTNVEVTLRQPDIGRLSLQGSARSGDGHLDIRGETSLSSTSGIRTELTLNGENFTLLQLPDWQVSASPAIAVVLDDSAMRVSGELRIPKASINIHTVPETAERPSADVIVYRENEAIREKQRVLYVDVRTILGDAVFLSGFGLTTGLEGSVRIAGNSNTPYTSSGRVVLREGRYQAYGQNLEIESGELIFNGPLTNPTLNVRATRTATDRTVAGIHLTGTPTQLKSQVYSEPAKGDAEALSYLLTGRALVNADSAQGDMLNQAAFALGLTSAGTIASRVRNELGFDTLGIQGGSDNRQFVAGKRFGDRLLVEYAYGMIDNIGTLLLRYQLSNRLILESRSGTARIVDLVYSVKRQ